jgi:WD40 repeat protein
MSVAFGADGRTLLTGYAGGARLWEWDGGKGRPRPAGPPLEHQAGVLSVALSADGRTALTGGTDGAVWAWDARTKRPLGPPWQHEGGVFAVGFARGDRAILAASTAETLRGVVRLWDVPRPVEAGVGRERLALWAQKVTGLRLENGGILQDRRGHWEECRTRLAGLGGPPSLEADLARNGERALILPPGPELPPQRGYPLRPPGEGPAKPAPPKSEPGAPPSKPPLPRLPDPAVVKEPFLRPDQVAGYLPAGATGVALVDLRRLLRSKLVHKRWGVIWDRLRDQPILKEFERAGVDPWRDLDGVILSTSPEGLRLVLRGRFKREGLTLGSVKGPSLGVVHPVRVGETGLFASLLDAGTLVLASTEKDARQAVKSAGKGPALVHKDLRAGLDRFRGEEGVFVALAITRTLGEKLEEHTPWKFPAYAHKLRTATAGLALDRAASLTVRIDTADEDTAMKLANNLGWLLKSEGLREVLPPVSVKRDGNSVVVSVKASDEELGKLLGGR